MDDRTFAVQIKGQRLQVELFKGNIREAFQFDSQDRGFGGAQGRAKAIGRHPLRLGNLEGPQSHVVGGPELAGHSFDRTRIKNRSLGNLRLLVKFALLRIGMKLRHRHRRHGPQVVRVKDIEQRFGDLRKVVVDAQVNPRRQQGKSLQHPFRVWIFAAIGLQHQARGDLGIFVRELRSIWRRNVSSLS